MAWLVDYTSDPLDTHVIPLDDLRPHEPSLRCWCHPVLDEPGNLPDEGPVLVHNPMDCRDQYEPEGGPLPLH